MRALYISLAAVVMAGSSASAQPQQTPIRVEDFIHAGENGVTLVKDPIAAVSFRLPQGWILRSGYRWGTYETTLTLRETSSNLTASLYYQYPLQTSRSSDADTALQGFVKMKARQRRDRDGLTDYRIREETIQRRTVAGRPALSYFAEFTSRGKGEPMSEYMMSIMGANIKALCFVTEPAAVNIDAFVKRLDAVAETLDIPAFPTMNITEFPQFPQKP